VAEHLLCKLETLSSSPSSTEEKEKDSGRKEKGLQAWQCPRGCHVEGSEHLQDRMVAKDRPRAPWASGSLPRLAMGL
jgi:hypothetical protein